MKKILIGYLINSTSGINNYLYNVIDAIKEDSEIHCLIADNDAKFIEMLKKRGVTPHLIDRLTSPIKRYKQIKQLCKKYNFSIAYFNISEAFNMIGNLATKFNSKATIITHSHSSNNDTSNIIKRMILKGIHTISKGILNHTTDYYYACSDYAGIWMFGKRKIRDSRFRIIRNTVDTKKFEFSENTRAMIRKQYDLSEMDKVIGFVGNFLYQKNVFYVLDIFNALRAKDHNYRFIMIGGGILEDEVKKKQEKLNLDIIYTGKVSDVYKYMNAMDALVLPSVFEGLPIVGIEAQVNGLPCFFSDTITKSTTISSNAYYIDIKKSANVWADIIHEKLKNSCDRCNVTFENIMIDSKMQWKEFKEIFLENKF